MTLIRLIAVTLILSVALLALTIRLWPLSPERWHQPLRFTESRDLPGGVERVIMSDDASALLERLSARMTALPRTTRLVGSTAEGRISFVTRSALWGFPDVTVLEAREGAVLVRAHLVFGKSDLGVNRARIETLLAP